MMKLSDYKCYRDFIGGVWARYVWYDPYKKRTQSEWRKVHNGRWAEYECTDNESLNEEK